MANYNSIHTGSQIDTKITDTYTKTETDNSFYTKTETNNNFYTQSQIDNLLSNYFVTQDISVSTTLEIAANSFNNYSIDVSKSGYTPLGIVSLTGSGTGQLNLIEFFLSGNTAKIYYRNNQTAAKSISKMTITVLYKKS